MIRHHSRDAYEDLEDTADVHFHIHVDNGVVLDPFILDILGERPANFHVEFHSVNSGFVRVYAIDIDGEINFEDPYPLIRGLLVGKGITDPDEVEAIVNTVMSELIRATAKLVSHPDFQNFPVFD